MDHQAPHFHTDNPEPDPGSSARASANGLLVASRHLVGSAEPAVVFGSLARLCATEFCDFVVIDICEGENAQYRISYPRDRYRLRPGPQGDVPAGVRSDARSDGTVHSVAFTGGDDEQAPYNGTAWFSWQTRVPTPAEETIAALLIDRSVALVAQQRVEDDLDGARRLAADLQVSLRSDRRVGIAIGILMRTHAITEEVALHRLRVASQNNRQQLHDITDEVVRVGYLDRCLVPTRRLWPHNNA